MANAVQAGTVKTNDILTRIVGKWIGFMNSWVREYPWFAYLGFWPANWYKMTRNINGQQAGAMYQLEKFTDVSFAKISKIEATISEDGKKIEWYEWESFSTSSLVATASTTTALELVSVSWFAVGDIVRTMPAAGSGGTEVQTTITAINTTTKVLTLAVAVDAEVGDKLLFVAPKLTIGNKVTRTVADPDSKTVITYFQKYGWSVKVDSTELNKTRLLADASSYASNEFNKPKMQILENIINTWFFGANVWGTSPEAQGIITVINEREARGQDSIFSMASITDDKAKLAELQRILNLASTAPIYSGSEKPTVFCNTEFSARVSRLLQSVLVYNDMVSKNIEYGLESLTTPYFKNINFIVLPEMDRIYGNVPKAIVFPRELVWFRVPENEYLGENGTPVKVQSSRFSVIAQPVTTNDFREYSVEYKLANIFAGQSYDNAYMLINGLN